MRPVLLLLLIVVCSAQDARGQAVPLPGGQPGAFVGLTITRADLVVEGQVATEQALLGFIETRVGTPLSMLEVRETIAHLYSLGRYQDIIVEAAPAPGGPARANAAAPRATCNQACRPVFSR